MSPEAMLNSSLNTSKTPEQLERELVVLHQKIAELERLSGDRQKLEASLIQAKTRLEQVIEERTAALRESNDYLLAEIAERVRTETQLKDHEQFLRSIYEGVADLILVIDVQGNETFSYNGANPAYERVMGITATDLQGKTPEQVWPLEQAIAAHYHYRDCVAAGTTITFEERVCIKGVETWWLTNLAPLRDKEGRTYRLISTSTNITERKHWEDSLQQQTEREKLLSAIALRIRQSLNLLTILNTTVEEVRQVLQTDRVLIYRFKPDWSGQVAVESVGSDWKSMLGRDVYDACFAENFVQAYSQGRINVIEDAHHTQMAPCYLEFLNKWQVLANLVVPILQGDQLWGLLVVHSCRAPRRWQPFEIDLVQQLATHVAIAVQQSELYQQAQTELAERKQAEVALQATKDQLQTALDAVPGIVSWISADLRYLGVNRHLAAMFNLSPEAFVGQELGFLQSSHEFDDFIRKFFASPEQDGCREITAKIGGDQRQYLIVAQKYEQDQAAFTIGIDITERQQAIEALKEAEEKYRTIFENAVEGIYQTTPDGRYLSANPAMARICGYDSPEELIANLISIEHQLYVDPERRFEFVRLLEECDTIINFESAIYRKDGSVTWVSENAHAIRDDQGKLLYYEGTVEDISERKQTQEALRRAKEELESRVAERTGALKELNQRLLVEIAERQRAEESLRASEVELRALFAAMTDGIAVFDAQGNYLKVVPTSARFLYKPALERVGKSVYDVLPRTVAENFVIQIQRALNQGKTVHMEYSLPVGNPETPTQESADEPEEAWFSANISPMPGNQVIWVTRDITERKQAEEALRIEQQKSDLLLRNVLPKAIVQRLKQNQRAIAEHYDEATILFADIVGFTPLAACMAPAAVVNLLNQIFSHFDQLAEEYGLEKIKTIGDAYMVVGGVPMAQANHVEAIAEMALKMQRVISTFNRQDGSPLSLRIGIHTGPVMAGVIGIRKFVYDLWGDTVNVASRMESQGLDGKIQVTDATYKRLKTKYLFRERGLISVKGRGNMKTYWLVGRKVETL